jgi:hypothetical protein
MLHRVWVASARRAVWSVTSSKPGNCVQNLRDDSTDTYWQCVACAASACSVRTHASSAGLPAFELRCAARSSALVPPRRSDGAQPHLVNISFQRKVELLVRPSRARTRLHTLASYVPLPLSSP